MSSRYSHYDVADLRTRLTLKNDENSRLKDKNADLRFVIRGLKARLNDYEAILRRHNVFGNDDHLDRREPANRAPAARRPTA